MKKLVLAILVVTTIAEKGIAQDKQSSLSYNEAYELINEDGCKLELLSPEFKRNKELISL